MKNKNLKFGQNIQQSLKGICIVALSLLVSTNAVSQTKKTHFGVSASSSLSGAGFGTMYTPGVYYKTDKTKIELGLNIQKRKFNMSGMQVNFEYILFDDQKGCYNDGLMGDLELFSFATVRYNSSAYLSKGQIGREKKINPDNNRSFDNLKFSAIEGYVGLGLKIRVVDNLKWSNSIGFGGWKTLSGDKSLYREYNSVSIALNTGLSFDF